MKLIITIISIFFLNGCAMLKEKHCSENAGYEQGVNDAKTGKLMSLNQYTTFCDAKSAALAQKGYKEGYAAGSDKGGSQMNLGFKNGKFTLTGAYKCSVDYAQTHFEESASTQAEARSAVYKKCHQKNSACSENAITCVKN